MRGWLQRRRLSNLRGQRFRRTVTHRQTAVECSVCVDALMVLGVAWLYGVGSILALIFGH